VAGGMEQKIGLVRLNERGAVRLDEFIQELCDHHEIDSWPVNLISEIGNVATARWACKTTAAIVNAIIAALPATENRHGYTIGWEFTLLRALMFSQ
jgi:hypothetical protein